MRIVAIFVTLVTWMPALLNGQQNFPEQVERAFGSNQELVNGIQFSNQYIRIEGNPYLNEGRFSSGSVSINDVWYEQVRIRYNLYTQRIEMEYRTPEGNLNQVITVAEQMAAFILEDYEFRRMQIRDEIPAYYQVLTFGKSTCYIGWSRELLGGGSSGSRFGPPVRKYWIRQGEHWMTFHNKKTYVRAFPAEQQKAFKKLLKKEGFFFQQATMLEMVKLIGATVHLYETVELP